MKSKTLPLLLCLTAIAGNLTAAIRAGIAVRQVTPDPLLPVSGGVGPPHPATRKARDPTRPPRRRKAGHLPVRALVLDQDNVRVAIVSSDFLGFPAVLGNRVRAAVTNVPAQNILIGATHTHSAPACYGFPDRSE